MIDKDEREDEMFSAVEHPGRLLEMRLEILDMGVKEFAVRTGKPEKTVIAVIKGDSAVTPDMAVAFEPVLQIAADIWMQAQSLYDIYLARLRRKNMIALSEKWMMEFPVDEMIARMWLPVCKDRVEKIDALFDFFGISTESAWEDYFLKQELKIAFGMSLADLQGPHSTSACLRYGEISAAKMQVKAPFSTKRLREFLPLIKSVMANEREGWYGELEELCGLAGIKLIFVPNLSGTTVTCVTRWIGDVPVIQFGAIPDDYAMFWLTFYRAVGHILLHGKKDIFIEGVDYETLDPAKEMEADKFASDQVLPKMDERRVIARKDFSPDGLRELAENLGTHPAIIRRRLVEKGII